MDSEGTASDASFNHPRKPIFTKEKSLKSYHALTYFFISFAVSVPEYLNVNLGTQLGKVVNGSHTTAGFKEDKRNKATPGTNPPVPTSIFFFFFFFFFSFCFFNPFSKCKDHFFTLSTIHLFAVRIFVLDQTLFQS